MLYYFIIFNLIYKIASQYKRNYISPNADIKIKFQVTSVKINKKTDCIESFGNFIYFICSIYDGDQCLETYNALDKQLPNITAQSWFQFSKMLNSSNSTYCQLKTIRSFCQYQQLKWERMYQSVDLAQWQQVILYFVLLKTKFYGGDAFYDRFNLSSYKFLLTSSKQIIYKIPTLKGLIEITTLLMVSCDVSFLRDNCNDANIVRHKICPQDNQRINYQFDVVTHSCTNSNYDKIGRQNVSYCLKKKLKNNCQFPLFPISVLKNIYTCIRFPLVYKSDKNPLLSNITYTDVEASEMITVSLSPEFRKLIMNKCSVVIYIQWKDEIRMINESTFKVNEYAKIPCCHPITIKLHFTTWKTFIYSIGVKYDFFVPPRNVRLNITGFAIYIGESVGIIADGYPQDKWVFDAYVLSNNFILDQTLHHKSVLKISNNAEIGPFLLLLYANVTFNNRPLIFCHSKNIYIIKACKGFVLGTINKDFYVPFDIILCHFDCYLTPDAFIRQITGETEFIKRKLMFQIPQETVGGIYSLTCSIMFQRVDFIYTRFVKVLILAPPQSICIQGFPILPGAFISCVHDGVENDMADMKLYLYNERRHLVSQSKHLLRLPFILTMDYFFIVCYVTYTNPFMNRIQDKNPKSFTISNQYYLNRRNTDLRIQQYINCSKFPFLYYLKFYVTYSNEKLFVPEIFSLMENILPESALLQWYLTVIVNIFLFLFIGFAVLFISVKKTAHDLFGLVTRARWKQKAGSLNRCLTLKTKNTEFFKNEKFLIPYSFTSSSETFSTYFYEI